MQSHGGVRAAERSGGVAVAVVVRESVTIVEIHGWRTVEGPASLGRRLAEGLLAEEAAAGLVVGAVDLDLHVDVREQLRLRGQQTEPEQIRPALAVKGARHDGIAVRPWSRRSPVCNERTTRHSNGRAGIFMQLAVGSIAVGAAAVGS